MKTVREHAHALVARGANLAQLAERAVRIAHNRGFVTSGLAGCTEMIAAQALGLIQKTRTRGQYALSQKGWKALYPGLAETRIARSTKTRVTLYEAEKADLDPEGGPWALVCEEHGSIVNHQTQKAARAWMSAPEEWCPSCRGDDS